MALQGSDYFPISRAGVPYKLLASDVLAYITANIGSTEYDVANITSRNALTGLSTGDRVFVADATGDATVSSGWAIYVWRSGAFTKIAEQEGLDISVAGTNLSTTVSPTNMIVVSNTGNDATLPLADATNAGLLAPAQFNKLGYLTVTANTDLDAMRAASHAAVTLAGTATTNPLTLSGQQLGFSIANLATAPQMPAALTDESIVSRTGTLYRATVASILALVGSDTNVTLGYQAGNGGTVTQATSKATAVTLNKRAGEVTLNAASLAAATIVSFALNNSTAAVGDIVVATHHAAGTFGAYGIAARVTFAGVITISVRNNSAAALAEAIVIKFIVLKAPNV